MKRFLFFAMYMATICCAIFESPLQAHGFAAGTLVKSPTGYIPIEQIKPGEEVICFDLQNQCVTRKVTHIHQFKSRELAHLIINGEFVICDVGHQFYVLDAERPQWVQARHLMRDWKILSHCVDACFMGNT